MKKKFFLLAACFALFLGAISPSSGTAQAQEVGTLYYYHVPESEYRDHFHAWQVFLEYNLNREQCQHYQDPPAGYVMKGCDVYRLDSVAPAAGIATTTTAAAETTQKVVPQAAAARSSYTIYFDFDKSNVRKSEKEKLNEAMQEIKQYNPAEVTVSGYADRAGTEEYNQKLSERRAGTVAGKLTAYGINSAIIDQEAYGETRPAVPTADGVRLQANRRAVIYFNH